MVSGGKAKPKSIFASYLSLPYSDPPPLPPGVGAAAGAHAGLPRAYPPPASELESRFFRWGGCVRSVFDICDTSRNEELKAISTTADLNALNDAV